MSGEAAAAAIDDAAGQALDLRDRALAALDEGDPHAALAVTGDALAVLEAAGLSSGPDAAAVLVARAEIEESLDRFGDAAATVAAAAALLDVVAEGGDDDCLLLWCQAQERLAGLERLAGDFGAAAARLGVVLDRASAAFGEASPAVVSAANALGVVHKYAADFDAAEAAYRRAMAAADGRGDPDPLILAGAAAQPGRPGSCPGRLRCRNPARRAGRRTAGRGTRRRSSRCRPGLERTGGPVPPRRALR